MAKHSFAGGQNIAEAQEYRNYVVGKMSFEISEIIRVLQYTTYEEEGGNDPLNDMKKAASLFDSNMGPAMKWVSTPTESAGGLGKLDLARAGWGIGFTVPKRIGWGIGFTGHKSVGWGFGFSGYKKVKWGIWFNDHKGVRREHWLKFHLTPKIVYCGAKFSLHSQG